jgi:monoamine oxidase
MTWSDDQLAQTERCDVVVVGAGLAGLSAARRLLEAGVSVAVLEARDRVGGRTFSVWEADDRLVEYGGQWIGPTQDAVLGLIDELGLDTFTQPVDGDNVMLSAGTLLRYSGAMPVTDAQAGADLMDAMVVLTDLAMEIDPAAPWAHPRAHELDAVTVETWITARPYCDGAKRWLRALTRALFPAEPGEISLLHALFYIRSGNGLERMIGTVNSAQERRITVGAQRLAEGLARMLEGRIRLACPVFRIDHGPDAVVVHHDRGRVRAQRVIVAIPPTLAGRLRYSPPMPGFRDQLTQRSFMGSVIKVHLFYPTPFWRAAGLSGHTVSDSGLVGLTFDQTHPEETEGALVAFIDAAAAREAVRMPEHERRARVLDDLARIFGDTVRAPVACYEKVWMDDEWSRGCYVGILSPGTWSTLGPALREAVGPIHWAGAETALRWNGYMDGAIRSGEDAASAVLTELSSFSGLGGGAR